jgi:hypothetical protein
MTSQQLAASAARAQQTNDIESLTIEVQAISFDDTSDTERNSDVADREDTLSWPLVVSGSRVVERVFHPEREVVRLHDGRAFTRQISQSHSQATGEYIEIAYSPAAMIGLDEIHLMVIIYGLPGSMPHWILLATRPGIWEPRGLAWQQITLDGRINYVGAGREDAFVPLASSVRLATSVQTGITIDQLRVVDQMIATMQAPAQGTNDILQERHDSQTWILGVLIFLAECGLVRDGVIDHMEDLLGAVFGS